MTPMAAAEVQYRVRTWSVPIPMGRLEGDLTAWARPAGLRDRKTRRLAWLTRYMADQSGLPSPGEKA